jgi:pimeloyl-ACP methyl ester carboxylesterase
MTLSVGRAEVSNAVGLHYLEAGKGNDVILLHGGMGDCFTWQAPITAMSLRFRVIAYSRRHHYPNNNPVRSPPDSIDDDIADLHAFMHRRGCGPAHLIGTSYGAMVALCFTMKHPRSVRSLVLAEPPLHRWACRTPSGTLLYVEFMHDVWIPANAAFHLGLDTVGLQLLVDGISGRPCFSSLSRERLEIVLRNARAMKRLTNLADAFPDLDRGEVAALTVPVMLMEGALSSKLHRSVMAEVALVLPAAPRMIVPDAGHAIPSDNPSAFIQAALAFLADLR